MFGGYFRFIFAISVTASATASASDSLIKLDEPIRLTLEGSDGSEEWSLGLGSEAEAALALFQADYGPELESYGEIEWREEPALKKAKKKRTQKHTFSTWQKLNPIFWIGNADTPEPPAWYKPNGYFRKLRWQLRNPLHNFTHYVIGVTDHAHEPEFIRVGLHPDDVFAPKSGWNHTVIQYKGRSYPFVSYWDARVRFYFGWRQSGNFGIKLLRGKTENP